MPKPSEVARLIVRGVDFKDWESVWVQQRWTEAYPIFRFTCAEREPLPRVWTDLQFKPGDPCQIVLGGELAISGVILERQVAYDATSHMVQLSGVGMTWYATKSSVLHETNNFDGKDFETVAREVLAPFGVTPIPIGQISKTPFKELQCQPGENVWDFLERLARVRRIVLGSDEIGNILMIGDHPAKVVNELVEGINILKMQCVLSFEDSADIHRVLGAKSSHDDEHGRETKEQMAEADGKKGHKFSITITPAEQPTTQAELPERAAAERQWHEYTDINANITVQGWHHSGGSLAGQIWKAGQDVKVKSPMALLNHVLTIVTATFTQDSASGTLTTLECVNPRLVSTTGANIGTPGINSDPPTAKSGYWKSAAEMANVWT